MPVWSSIHLFYVLPIDNTFHNLNKFTLSVVFLSWPDTFNQFQCHYRKQLMHALMVFSGRVDFFHKYLTLYIKFIGCSPHKKGPLSSHCAYSASLLLTKDHFQTLCAILQLTSLPGHLSIIIYPISWLCSFLQKVSLF